MQYVSELKAIFPRHFVGARVLEIGSLDVNGSVRVLFEGCEYTGIDVAPGHGVDVVCEGQRYDAPDASFDTVISCEAMEHNPYWKETFLNMVRLCKPDGLVIMTCATFGRGEHGTTRSEPEMSPLTTAKGWDHYRNLRPKDFIKSGALAGLRFNLFFENWHSYDLYFVGAKQELDATFQEAVDALARRYRRNNLLTWRGLRHSLKARFLIRK
jgi:SAM-dependent methyltransferase